MSSEMMDLEQLASYLQRDAREIDKLANRGYLPGQKVSGRWRFARAEINHWLETQMPAYSDEQLTVIEGRGGYSAEDPVVTPYLSETSIAVPLTARSRTSVLKELVRLAEQSWNVYDPEAILQAVQQREEKGSTALPTGVAIPHPHRPLPAALGDTVLAYGRSPSGLPFGDPRGGLTDIFFLVCSQDDRIHLQILARLSRLLLRPGFLDELRAAETAAETYQLIQAAEQDLVTDS